MLSLYSEIALFFVSELIALSNQAIEDFPKTKADIIKYHLNFTYQHLAKLLRMITLNDFAILNQI